MLKKTNGVLLRNIKMNQTSSWNSQRVLKVRGISTHDSISCCIYKPASSINPHSEYKERITSPLSWLNPSLFAKSMIKFTHNTMHIRALIVGFY